MFSAWAQLNEDIPTSHVNMIKTISTQFVWVIKYLKPIVMNSIFNPGVKHFKTVLKDFYPWLYIIHATSIFSFKRRIQCVCTIEHFKF